MASRCPCRGGSGGTEAWADDVVHAIFSSTHGAPSDVARRQRWMRDPSFLLEEVSAWLHPAERGRLKSVWGTVVAWAQGAAEPGHAVGRKRKEVRRKGRTVDGRVELRVGSLEAITGPNAP